MCKMDRCIDVRQGYVKKGRQLFDGELDSTVRRASAPVIALWQGEGASSDGGSSTHEAAPRSELLVSSDGSSYAAPSAGLQSYAIAAALAVAPRPYLLSFFAVAAPGSWTGPRSL